MAVSLLLTIRRARGAAGPEIGISQLCVCVSVAVSKVLCYVCHSWAGLFSQQHTGVNDHPRSRHPQNTHHSNALYHQHHWSKTPKYTMKRKLNRNHVLGMDAVSSTSFILKHMKTQLCISSHLKNVQRGCVNAANLALQCVLERDKLLVSSFFLFFLHLHLSNDSTIKRKGTFCGLFLTLLLSFTTNAAHPNSGTPINNLTAPFTN